MNRSGGVSPARVELLRQMYEDGRLRAHIVHLLNLRGLDERGDNRTIGTRRSDPELDNCTVGQNWPR